MIRNVVAANAILLVQYAVGSLVPLLLIPHIVRSIGLAKYGDLSVSLAWGGYGALIVQYAFQLTGPRRIAIGEQPGQLFIEILWAKLILLLAISPLLALLAAVIPHQGNSLLARLPLFGLPLAASMNTAWFLQAQGKFMLACVAAVLGSTMTLVVGFGLITGNTVDSAVTATLATVIGPVLTAFITLMLASSRISFRSIRWSALRPGNSLSEGWPLFASQIISAFYTMSGPIVINYLLNARAAGAYSAIERIIGALMHACLLTHVAAYPSLATAYVRDQKTYWKLLWLVLSVYLSLSVAMSISVWTFRDAVMQFVLGGSVEAHALLGWGLAWLVVGIFGTALTGFLTVSGRSRAVLPLNLGVLFVAVAAGVPAVLIWGSAGWMAALVLSQVVVVFAGFAFLRMDASARSMSNCLVEQWQDAGGSVRVRRVA